MQLIQPNTMGCVSGVRRCAYMLREVESCAYPVIIYLLLSIIPLDITAEVRHNRRGTQKRCAIPPNKGERLLQSESCKRRPSPLLCSFARWKIVFEFHIPITIAKLYKNPSRNTNLREAPYQLGIELLVGIAFLLTDPIDLDRLSALVKAKQEVLVAAGFLKLLFIDCAWLKLGIACAPILRAYHTFESLPEFLLRKFIRRLYFRVLHLGFPFSLCRRGDPAARCLLLCDARNQYNAGVPNLDRARTLRVRRCSVEPSAVPIFVVRPEKHREARKAIFALHRLGAVANLVEVFTFLHPLGKLAECDGR